MMLSEEYAHEPYDDSTVALDDRTRRGSEKLMLAIQRAHPERYVKPAPLAPLVWPIVITTPAPATVNLNVPLATFGAQLILYVASAYGMSRDEFLSGCRLMRFVEARALVSDTLRHRGWSYPRIGQLLHRDKSAIINLCDKIDIYRRRSETFDDVYRALEPYRVRSE